MPLRSRECRIKSQEKPFVPSLELAIEAFFASADTKSLVSCPIFMQVFGCPGASVQVWLGDGADLLQSFWHWDLAHPRQGVASFVARLIRFLKSCIGSPLASIGGGLSSREHTAYEGFHKPTKRRHQWHPVASISVSGMQLNASFKNPEATPLDRRQP